MKVSALATKAYEFACHSAACRPPTSGGTGGSGKTLGQLRKAHNSEPNDDGIVLSPGRGGRGRGKTAEMTDKQIDSAIRSYNAKSGHGKSLTVREARHATVLRREVARRKAQREKRDAEIRANQTPGWSRSRVRGLPPGSV